MTHCSAEGLASARSIAGAADWATLLVTTGMSVEAVIIPPTLHLDAGNIGVALVTLLTGAHRVVGTCAARGLGRAGVAGDARVDAVLVDAGLGLGTVRVLRTLGPGCNWNTTRVTMGHVDT